MTTPALVALLTGFTALLAFALLIVRAFHKNTAWGLSVMLLSPPGAIAFGIKFWRQEKIVILAYLITLLTAVSLALYLFTSWGGWELVRTSQQVKQAILDHRLSDQDVHTLLTLSRDFDEQSGLDTQSSGLLAQAQKELELQAERQAVEEEAERTAASSEQLSLRNITKKAKPAQQRYRLAYVTIDVDDAPDYIGSTVKVTRKNVLEKEYRLISASANRLEFAQRTGSGSYTFRYRNSDIEKIRVLTREPY